MLVCLVEESGFRSHFRDNTTGNRSGSEAHQGGPGRPGVGCFGGRRGVKKSSVSMSKWGRMAASDRPTFSDLVGVDNENVSENGICFDETESSEVVDA